MKKSFLIARSNIRKAKAQTVSLVVLVLLASMMMNLWLMLSMDYKRNFDRYHDKLNAEHVTMALGSDDPEFRRYLSETIENDGRVTQYEMSDALYMPGAIPYNDGEINTALIFLNQKSVADRTVGKIEIVEDSNYTSGIYLPLLYNTVPIGETIDMTIGGNVVSYTVCGFLNSVMAGSSNCSMAEFILTDDMYKELEDQGFAIKSTLLSVRLLDKGEGANIEAILQNETSLLYPDVLTVSNTYNMVSQSRYVSQMICSGVVSAMSFLVILIAFVVIASNVSNYIQENMKNLGALKAMGYKSGQIIFALLLQFTGTTLLTAFVGVGISYGLFPAVNTMMIAQTGIPYEVGFLILPCLITIIIIGGAVTLAVWLSAHRIKRIEPIVALRAGVQTHNFKRNHVPLESTREPLNLALALKTTFSNVKQNVTVCITMLVVSLVVVFSGLMIENAIVDKEPLLNLIVGEFADYGININKGVEDEFIQEMSSDERVSKIYLYHTEVVRHVGGVTLLATMSDDFSKMNNQNFCVEGRYPKYDNEIAIAAKYAKETGLAIGDEITLTAAGNEETYLICGYTQTTNNLGKDCLLTRRGYEHMGELQNATYYINLIDGVEIDDFNEEINEQFGSDINLTANIRTTLAALDVYTLLLTVITIAVIVLSLIIITFVLYLLVRTMLNNKKQDYGIMKAIGFTTRQLIIQTALSFMPIVILSTIVGIPVSAFIINPLMAVFLSGLGIVKCNLVVPIGFITAAGIGLILFTFGMACLLSLRIKKVAPRKMLVGE